MIEESHGSDKSDIPVGAEAVVPNEALRKEITETKLFTSEKDREIALRFLGEIEGRLSRGEITKEKFDRAVTALGNLVPKTNERGFRRIVDINISPMMEQTIASRLESEEVDITSPEGSWGGLPEIVRKEIALSNIILEMTSNCTVRCSFCAFAEKGPIKRKSSLGGIKRIFQYFKDNQKIQYGLYRSDCLYWGTDVFDAKWKTEDGELDHSDVASMYWDILNKEQRFLYSSTAVPVGEEFRVLNFADMYVRKKRTHEISRFNSFRISMTNANCRRLCDIEDVLTVLHDNPFSDDLVFISDNRNQHEARRGTKWQEKDILISPWDVTGPNCRDGVVIGINTVDAIVMEGASNERPKGETRVPVREVDSYTGDIVYTIPRYFHKDDLDKERWEDIYPDTFLSTFTYNQVGNVKIEKDYYENNPHRAFARIMGIYENILMRHNREPDKITSEDKEAFRKTLTWEVELVNGYLDLGANNRSMKAWMGWFKENGYF